MVYGFLINIAKAASGRTLEAFTSYILPSENSPMQEKPEEVGDFGPLMRGLDMSPNRGGLFVRRDCKNAIGFFHREVV